jgi:biotin operon repressor
MIKKEITEQIDFYDHKIFGFLLKKINRDKFFSINELSDKTKISWNTIKKHCLHLKKLGIVKITKKGIGLRYRKD